MTMSILSTGSAGFIGSYTAKLFTDSGFEVVVLDNFATGRRENALSGVVVEGNWRNNGPEMLDG
jgi:UDP-glucose 4-epimerase